MLEIDKQHEKMIFLRNELHTNEEKLADPGSYKNQYVLKPLTNKIKDLKREIEELNIELTKLEDEYLDLAEMEIE